MNNPMKPFCFFAFFALLTPFFGINQENENWCGSDEIMQRHIDENPNYLEELSLRVQEVREIAKNNPSSRGTKYIVPVVFHIIHDGGSGNISMEQIQSGIDVMNEDFNAYNADQVNIRNTTDAPFRDIQGNVEVEFKLAKLDPNGNCTNGVQRKYAPHLTNDAGEACKYDSNGGLSAWPNNKYMNIWLVNSIAGSGAGTTLGYAFLPYNNWGAGHGILNRHDRVGRVGTAASNGGRTLTHEMGHICGLLHTFQNGCHTTNCNNNGDYVCDTPPVTQEFGCISTLNTCTEVPTNDFFGYDVLDQIENHMSYNTCRRMFSEGQKQLMHNVFDGIANFISITSPENIEATGVNLPDVICKADFTSNQTLVCVGQEVRFEDLSYHTPSEWSWTFTGGEPSVSTDQNPVVTYTTPGVYEVSLTVGDGTNSATETRSTFITVLNNDKTFPFIEGFEEYTNFADSDWFFRNTMGGTTFQVVNGISHSGDKSLRLPNFSIPAGRINELISSPIDMSEIEERMTLTYRYAYRKRNSGNFDWLRTYFSGNCGENWMQVASRRGSQLSFDVVTTSWSPASKEDWVTVHVSSASTSYFTNDFRVKFEFESDGGNNFFLDDINIYEGEPVDETDLSLDSETSLTGVSVYPNPSTGFFNVDFYQQNSNEVTIELVDLQGKIIQKDRIMAQPGLNSAYIQTGSALNGFYFVRISSNGTAVSTHKIVLK